MNPPRKNDESKCKFDEHPPTFNLHAELHTPKDIEEKRSTREKSQITIQKWIAAATWLTFFAAAYYGAIANGQWRAMQLANKVTGENFRRDQRAWMAFKVVGDTLTITIDKPFMAPVQLLNTGKTPAKNVQGNIVVGVFKKGEPLEFVYTPGHANYQLGGGTIFPNGMSGQVFQGIRHGEQKAEAIVITKSLWDEIKVGDSNIVVHGRITYRDIFRTEHWTTFCRYVTHPEMIPEDCTRYNDTDDN